MQPLRDLQESGHSQSASLVAHERSRFAICVQILPVHGKNLSSCEANPHIPSVRDRTAGQHTRWESIYGIAYYPHRTISYNIVIRKINQVNFQKSYEQLYCTSSPVSGSNRFIYASTTYPSESTLQPDTGFPFASTTVPFST